jgi:hypothetical protein
MDRERERQRRGVVCVGIERVMVWFRLVLGHVDAKG